MKNYQLIDLLKLVVVFFLGYLFLYHYVPWNLEKYPKKLSEKLRKINVRFFSVAMFGFFLLYGLFLFFGIKYSFFSFFFFYYSSVFALMVIMAKQLILLKAYEKLDNDIDILLKFFRESTDRSGQKGKLNNIINRLLEKQSGGKKNYYFWLKIL